MKDNKNKNMKPFYRISKEKDEKVLKWLTLMLDKLGSHNKARLDQTRFFRQLYLGASMSRSRTKTSLPLIHEVVEKNVSQVPDMPISQSVLPANDEPGDIMSAKVAGMVVDTIMQKQDYRYKLLDMVRASIVDGEAFMKVSWDVTAGDMTFEEVQLSKLKRHSRGSSKYNRPLTKTGDITLSLKYTDDILLQPRRTFNDVDWYICKEYVSKYELQDIFGFTDEQMNEFCKEMPEMENHNMMVKNSPYSNGKLKSGNDILKEMIPFYTFIHKKTPFLPEGAKISFLRGKILHKTTFKYSMEGLDLVQLKDLDIAGCLNGRSRIQLIQHVLKIIHNIEAADYKYAMMASKVKILTPKGGIIKPEALGNNDAFVEYRANMNPPQPFSMPTMPVNLIQYKNILVDYVKKFFGMHPISDGASDRSIRPDSGTAIQLLNNLEFKSADRRMRAIGKAIREIYEKTLSVAGDYYRQDDKRMISIVGENNRHILKAFDVADLNKPYVIRLESSDGFIKSSAAQAQEVRDLMAVNPQLASPEQWIEWLKLNKRDSINNAYSEALEAAEMENEAMLKGEEVSPPEDHEIHLAHWEKHSIPIQSNSFKDYVSNEQRAVMLGHLADTEIKIIEQMQINPTLQARVTQFPEFPLTRKAKKYAKGMLVSQQEQTARVQGESNRGAEITASVGDLTEVNKRQGDN